jgi:hypothetical protein
MQVNNMVAVADVDHHDEAVGTFQLSGQRKDTSLRGKIINVYRANVLIATERISNFHITLNPKFHHSHQKSCTGPIYIFTTYFCHITHDLHK